MKELFFHTSTLKIGNCKLIRSVSGSGKRVLEDIFKGFYLLKIFKGGIDSDHLILSTHGHQRLKTSLPCVQWWAIWWIIWRVMTQNCKMFLIKHGRMCANAPIVSTHWRRGPRCQYNPLVAAVEDHHHHHHHHHHRHHVDPLEREPRPNWERVCQSGCIGTKELVG